VELLDRAIFINEQEPYFHCFRSNNLAEMLIHNKARLGPSDVQKTLEIIDISVQNCIKLSINREHPISMAAYTYLILYDKKLFFDRKKVLETLKLAHLRAPQNPDILLKMAAVYFDAGDMDNYLLHANKSIEMKIDYIPAYMDLISYYYNEKNLNAAQALIQRVLKIQFISAEFIPALKLLAELSLKNNDKDSAEAVLKFYDENFYITQL
jgi:tetratricopeptide (TPR) repeat protein